MLNYYVTQQFYSLVAIQKNWKQVLKNMYKSIHNSIIHNS